mgnify:FL=1
MRLALLFASIILVMTSCSSHLKASDSAIPVTIVKTESGYQLLRDGQPYRIKGVGMPANDIAAFAAHGGNSIRNWNTSSEDDSTLELLDTAQANGVTVSLCFYIPPERHDFDYDDEQAVDQLVDYIRKEAMRYRNHPALLTWIIGNELNLGYTNPRVYDVVNRISEMLHELDPNHPTTTTLSEADAHVIELVQSRAPDLDFMSFQAYGSLFVLPELIEEIGFEEPFMVTEWGAIGYWEMEQTPWGVPVEMTSTEKADTFLRAHQDKLQSLEGQLIGSYAFMWGQKQERTPTWFGMFTEWGEETEVVDVMHYIWNGKWPSNRTPQVQSLHLDGKNAKQGVTLISGESYEARFEVSDPENDPLKYRWEVKPESEASEVGGDFETPYENLELDWSHPTDSVTRFIAPAPGNYRLYALSLIHI